MYLWVCLSVSSAELANRNWAWQNVSFYRPCFMISSNVLCNHEVFSHASVASLKLYRCKMKGGRYAVALQYLGRNLIVIIAQYKTAVCGLAPGVPCVQFYSAVFYATRRDWVSLLSTNRMTWLVGYVWNQTNPSHLHFGRGYEYVMFRRVIHNFAITPIRIGFPPRSFGFF